jgi:hypothetical protein
MLGWHRVLPACIIAHLPGAVRGLAVRIESVVTSVSWIPRDAVTGLTRFPFELVGHYDAPPPELLGDLEALRAADGFRFANELRGWIDVEDGRIVAFGQSGGGRIGATTLALGRRQAVIRAVALPDLRLEPEVTTTSVRFVQTAGGRTGMPAPRRVHGRPFVQIAAPLAWTTLALTLTPDSARYELVGASPFPRHWVYDAEGRLASKTGLIDFDHWYRDAFGHGTPWGGEESPAVVTAVESALERSLSAQLLAGRATPPVRRLATGETLVEQGQRGDELFLLFDGVLAVEIDGETVGEMCPGSILGEQALFSGGRRVATLRAVTPCRLFVVTPDQLAPAALEQLARSRRPASD